MSSMSVLCPLCARNSFTSIDALRCNLIKVANDPLTCPVCNQLFLGLDKLTIHLFSHTNIMNTIEIMKNETNINNSNDNKTKLNNLDSQSIKEIKTDINLTNNNEQHMEIIRNDEQSYHCHNEKYPNLKRNPTINSIETRNFNEKINELGKESTRSLLNKSEYQHQNISSSIVNNCKQLSFQCHLCKKKFKSNGSLRVHLKIIHTNNINSKLKDNKIDISNPNNSLNQEDMNNINNHIFEYSKLIEEIKQPIVSNNDNYNDNDKTEESTNTLDYFMKKQSLITNNSKQNLFVINKKFLNNTLNDNFDINIKTNSILFNNTNSIKLWKCDVCSKNFTTKYFLKKHKRLHTGEMPYTCLICGRTFTFQQSYHKHLLYHNDEKPHLCCTCGRSFKELSTLHNHERIHSGEKPFKCEICGKCFRQRVSFLVHSRIHSGIMPYKCNLCQRSFRYKVSQRTHKCTISNQIYSNINTIQETLRKNSLRKENFSLKPNNMITYPKSTITDDEQNLTIEQSQQSTALSSSLRTDNYIKTLLVNTRNINCNHLTVDSNHQLLTDFLENQDLNISTCSDSSISLLAKTIDDIALDSYQTFDSSIETNNNKLTNSNNNVTSMSTSMQYLHFNGVKNVTTDLNGFECDFTRCLLENAIDQTVDLL